MSIPKEITRDAVLRAIEVIDVEGIPKKHKARNTFLVINGKTYPVKYVILKAAKIAGIELDNKFDTGDAKNFLEKLGFKTVRENWEFGIQILKQSSKLFLEYAQSEGINVLPDQLGTFSKGSTQVYYQLKLPESISKTFSIGNRIHFEWLATLKEDSATFRLGLHIEFPKEKKEVNRKLGDALLERVNLSSLEEKINTKIERKDLRVYTWIMTNRTSEDPANEKEEIIEWMARSMVEFYQTFLPMLEEVLPDVLEVEFGNEKPKILTKIDLLLTRKGQIILYGPPGT